MSYTYRAATAADGPTLLRLVTDLATYERAADQVVATADDLGRALGRGVEATLVFDGEEAVGFALWFRSFSTWQGRAGLFLEDLYVAPSHRGRGLGVGLLARLAARCEAEGLGRFEWRVLDWNAPSIAFYEALGATPLREWITYRLEGERLQDLARRAR